MIIVTADQGTDEWFQARLGKATGSNFSAVLATVKSGEAATRKNYRVQLALERITGKRADGGYTNQAMQDGVAREPIARDLYEFSTGNTVEQVGFCLHDTLECGVSPDGLVRAAGMVEIKCPTPSVHLDYLLRTTPPPEYVAQIQGQLWVTDRQWVDFVTYNPDFPSNARFRVMRVERDEAYIKTLAEAIRMFMIEVAATERQIANYGASNEP